MKNIFTAFLLLVVCVSSMRAQDAIEGRWKGEIGFSKMYLRLKSSLRSERGHGDMSCSEDILLKEFQGLAQALNSANSAEFTLPREAGIFTFKGEFSDDKGTGDFKFEINPAFANSMKALGYGKLATDQVFTLALNDVGTAFVKEMQTLGYNKLAIDKLVEIVIHDVTPTFIKEMSELGYKNLSIDQLVQLRIHGVDADYVRAMNEALGKSRQ